MIDGHFVIVYALGEESLGDRLQRRLSLRTGLDYFDQMLAALDYAHERRIIHCDIKPENMILFPGNRLRLTDFGIARVALRTLVASGSGTVGYMAPEQAMGKPSFASDVFAAGLILYRMASGHLPEWPFAWPLPGLDRVQRSCSPELIEFMRRCLEVNSRRRFPDACAMYAAWRRIRPRALRPGGARRRANGGPGANGTSTSLDWKQARRKQFQREFGRQLETRHACSRCQGPVSEAMQWCPWCGTRRATHRGETRFPTHCRRCRRGMKLDWRFCPWCYGAGVPDPATREYSDVRYVARCSHSGCTRRDLMPWMQYCPWCHRKVSRRWKVEGSRAGCCRCGWGLAGDYWSWCPWCGRKQGAR